MIMRLIMFQRAIVVVLKWVEGIMVEHLVINPLLYPRRLPRENLSIEGVWVTTIRWEIILITRDMINKVIVQQNLRDVVMDEL
ncbi:hypothetical protein GUJ93_ZPchr0006g42331 [Zizania palustris]|uniref:Uncharacterized protein n=1 Tax=Zizania palustris TaxID=103762 RepID=A0A8J5VJB4_ZIZPA|nr:hypothetical protein GUJ93_ZPchr0006g42331 [Zizania palustris]